MSDEISGGTTLGRLRGLLGMRKSLLIWGIALAAALAVGSTASASSLDQSFGRSGVAVVPAPSPEWQGAVASVVEGGGGRLLAVGTSEDGITVTRLDAEGEIDTSFGAGGLVVTTFGRDIVATAAVRQRDGRLVVVGGGPGGSREGFIALARYMPDGSLDQSFGRKGKVMMSLGVNGGRGTAVALQRGGRIAVAGTARTSTARSEGLVARFRPDGSLDRDFGSNGVVRLGPRTSLQDLRGSIGGRLLVAGGSDGRLLLGKLRFDGRYDRSFGKGGRTLIDVDGGLRCHLGRCAELQALDLDGRRIVAVGRAADESGSYSALIRLRRDGTLDRSRGITRIRQGLVLNLEDIAVRGNDIVAAGYFEGRRSGSVIEVLKFNRDGRPDRGFADAGVFRRQVGYDSTVFSSVFDRNARVVVGGYARPGKPPQGFVESPSPFEDMHMLLMRFTAGN
jgi:uncharacterized delta-60 repeat protein